MFDSLRCGMLGCGVCAVPAARPQQWTGGFVVYVWLVLACTTGAGRCCPASWERRHAADPRRLKSPQPDRPRDSDRVLGRLVGDHPVQDVFISRCRASDRDVSRRVSQKPEVFGRAGDLSVSSSQPARRASFRQAMPRSRPSSASPVTLQGVQRAARISSNSEEPRGGRPRAHSGRDDGGEQTRAAG